jgi:altronate dehydratase
MVERSASNEARSGLDTASGPRSRSELHGYGRNEFVPWQISVVT